MTTMTTVDTNQESGAIAKSLMSLPYDNRIIQLHDMLMDLPDKLASDLSYSWKLWARPDQLPPPEPWSTWLVLAGRGFGKTRVGSEWIRARVSSGQARRIALVAKSPHEAENIMVIGESNNGGDLIFQTLRSTPGGDRVSYRHVRAVTGKRIRAEPVSSSYEQRKVHHVGIFPKLEDQLCAWNRDSQESPDRMDALVWAITHLTNRPTFKIY